MKEASITCKANCGCGWKAQNDGRLKVGDVLVAADKHHEDTGHTVEFSGMIKKTEVVRAFVPQEAKPFYRPGTLGSVNRRAE